MKISKMPAAAMVAAAAMSTLAACGTETETATPETVTVTESQDAGDQDVAAQPTDQREEKQAAQLPASVSGYTDEARNELADKGVTEADVERALEAANNNEAGVSVEWDDDGYYEIEFQDIEIDIRPDGTVTEVDR
ncbi:hypothetical protein SAMN04488535_1540 [Corynebacterium mycetoides]|uniref:Peptidase propeptide and YPEB domain-containing protein n=1 Tax=Corynebacterium mycetoides TaxID=38302 RepID=A0A1G9PQ16_9CORY|nr:hypothetical protein [Corynebacterium mycetoides]SDM00581.1 hypothetical protein SAMN04488535_1540 [Corynebacterium mycetoides]